MHRFLYFHAMIEREMKRTLLKAAKEYPVVLVHGPRQSGKTTLCKESFPQKPYVSLENPDVRLRAKEDPRGFLGEYADGAILDEIQRLPELLSYLQQIVDDCHQNGLFVLTGSDSFALRQETSQTLAGRIAVLTLLPLSISETKDIDWLSDADLRMISGGYPRNISERPDRSFFYRNYIASYVERDVRRLVNIKDSDLFRRFLTLCAGRVGALIDYASLSNDCGISVKTVKEWLAILGASFICFQLEPWFVNRTKRLVKTPKLYFYDTGLACALLGIDTPEQLSRDPLRGGIFENLVILEKMKQRFNAAEPDRFWFYRTSAGVEIDLVEECGRELLPTEIKSAATFNADFVKNFATFEKEYPECGERTVAYAGSESFAYKGVQVKNYLEI